MKSKQKKFKIFLIALITLIMMNIGCFTIMSVDQPSSATVGETLNVTVVVRTEGHDNNPHFGILGLLIPNDWAVDTVSYSGDFGPDGMSFLHPDSVDGDPGGQVDFWTDSLEAHIPSGDTLMWVVYQANTPFANPDGSGLDTGFVDVSIQMTVGQTQGTFDIGYFVTNAALDFSDSTWFNFSLDNPIEITGPTSVEDRGNTVPERFSLQQNYPNPFNPATTIKYQIKERTHVSLKVFDLLGHEVTTLVNGVKEPGTYNILFSTTDLASGVYIYTLRAGDFEESRRMILMK